MSTEDEQGQSRQKLIAQLGETLRKPLRGRAAGQYQGTQGDRVTVIFDGENLSASFRRPDSYTVINISRRRTPEGELEDTLKGYRIPSSGSEIHRVPFSDISDKAVHRFIDRAAPRSSRRRR
jgi:hypothetical protein